MQNTNSNIKIHKTYKNNVYPSSTLGVLGLQTTHRLHCLSLPVRLHVFLQLYFGGESLPAALTLRLGRLLPGMAALVPGQLRRAFELELADVAGVRPLARVDALVQLGLAQGEEGLLAVLAGEGPLSRVDQIVPGERVRLGEALPAVGAGEGTGATVGDDVLLLGFLAFEPFVTLGTGVGLVVHVRAVVF